MRRYIILNLFIIAVIFCPINAQTLDRDSLYSEFRHFIGLLEETHPDPYNEFNGKVGFHSRAIDMGKKLKEQDYTLVEYQNLLSSFLSTLRDGHTYISKDCPSSSIAYKHIPMRLRTYSDGMLVTLLPAGYDKYIGSRLVAINHIPLDSLLKTISQITSCENKYGEYLSLEYAFFNPTQLAQLFPDVEDKITISVLTPDNHTEEFSLPLATDNNWYNEELARTPRWEKTASNDYLYCTYVDDEKQIMYLKMKSVMSKECFQAMHKGKWPGFEEQLHSFYKWTLRKEMPDDIEQAINGIPTFAKIFREMLVTMRNNNSQNLIIDLRNNGGGWTPITLSTLYMMYGDSYLEKDMGIIFRRIISPLYLQKINQSLDEFNTKHKTNYKLGDYAYQKGETNQKTLEQTRSNFINNLIGEAGDYVSDLNGQPLYTPSSVYVITNASTFSAAFHYAFYLWKMGATVVGVPSAQAPNTFMEITEFELPYTKTKGSFSNSAQYFLPPDNKRARIFWPEEMPVYEEYKKYNFDQDSELLWLIDRIKN